MKCLPPEGTTVTTADESLSLHCIPAARKPPHAPSMCVFLAAHVSGVCGRDKAEQWGGVSHLQRSDQMSGRKLQLGSWEKKCKAIYRPDGMSLPI